ncbi:hypothetical protein DIJ63_23565 [Burkholderia pseudomallei]|nr:hypothetical protein DIJ63_23565 [Burkholderia pseudomallei]
MFLACLRGALPLGPLAPDRCLRRSGRRAAPARSGSRRGAAGVRERAFPHRGTMPAEPAPRRCAAADHAERGAPRAAPDAAPPPPTFREPP